jgi:soluble P-type ATPase
MSLTLTVPGRETLILDGVLCDMNGTLATDGKLAPEVGRSLTELSQLIKVYVMTADTFGTAAEIFTPLPVELVGMPPGLPGTAAKLGFLKKLGPDTHIAIGNGYNDHLMLKEAAVGICIVGDEGAHRLSLKAADLVVTSPLAALNLLLQPKRLLAGLRN